MYLIDNKQVQQNKKTKQNKTQNKTKQNKTQTQTQTTLLYIHIGATMHSTRSRYGVTELKVTIQLL